MATRVSVQSGLRGEPSTWADDIIPTASGDIGAISVYIPTKPLNINKYPWKEYLGVKALED